MQIVLWEDLEEAKADLDRPAADGSSQYPANASTDYPPITNLEG